MTLWVLEDGPVDLPPPLLLAGAGRLLAAPLLYAGVRVPLSSAMVLPGLLPAPALAAPLPASLMVPDAEAAGAPAVLLDLPRALCALAVGLLATAGAVAGALAAAGFVASLVTSWAAVALCSAWAQGAWIMPVMERTLLGT